MLEGIFVGYEENRIGWRVRTLTGKYIFSRDVVFSENVRGRLSSSSSAIPRIPTLPSLSLTPSTSLTPSLSSIPTATNLDPPMSIRPPSPPITPLSPPHPPPPTRPPRKLTEFGRNWAESVKTNNERLLLLHAARAARSAQISLPDLAAPLTSLAIDDFASLAHSDRFIIPSEFSSPASFEAQILRTFAGLSTSPDQHPLSSCKTVKIFDINKPPDNYREAIACSDTTVWHQAMQWEVDGLHARQVFEETTLPPGRKLIGLRWVYAYKYDPEGNIIHGNEKARLVAQGFSQRPDDYGETYAPVCKLMSVHIILAHAAQANLEIYQFDAKLVFLNTLIGHHKIFCGQIPGFPLSNPAMVYRILRALYGLRQSAFEWYVLLRSTLENLGFVRCEVDHGIFVGKWTTPPLPSIPMPTDGSDLIMIVPVHVDDGLTATNSPELWRWFIIELNKSFEISDLGPAALYLGIHITRDRVKHKLWLSQKSFISNLLTSYKLLGSHPQLVPLRHPLHLLPTPPPNALPNVCDCDITAHYQALVGSITYLAVCTRPNLAYTAMALGQFNANPS
jgi:hypothetical protein